MVVIEQAWSSWLDVLTPGDAPGGIDAGGQVVEPPVVGGAVDVERHGRVSVAEVALHVLHAGPGPKQQRRRGVPADVGAGALQAGGLVRGVQDPDADVWT